MSSKKISAIKIGNKTISYDHPCFIIAEAGVNHNGSLKLAKKLVDAAVAAGADAVKFQTFKAEKLVTKNAKQADYQAANIGKEETQFDMLKRLELKEDFHPILKKYCEKKGIIFMSTPFDEDSIDFLDSLGVLAFKAGSSESNNHPYMRRMAGKQKPMIISFGMSTMEEVKATVKVIEKAGALDRLVVLHCTTNYPTLYDEVNMRAMTAMQNELPCFVGYSDHTQGIEIPIMARVLGAVVIEKHFTLDRNMEGPDHKASLEPDELKQMVDSIRHIEAAFGSDEKKPALSELKIAEIARKSIVARKRISAGKKLEPDDLIIKRPGTGIPPTKFDEIIGRKTTADIKEDELLSWEKIEK